MSMLAGRSAAVLRSRFAMRGDLDHSFLVHHDPNLKRIGKGSVQMRCRLTRWIFSIDFGRASLRSRPAYSISRSWRASAIFTLMNPCFARAFIRELFVLRSGTSTRCAWRNHSVRFLRPPSNMADQPCATTVLPAGSPARSDWCIRCTVERDNAA